jgi:outer membrane protein OmpA-like peptidoglycan-associated protein
VPSVYFAGSRCLTLVTAVTAWAIGAADCMAQIAPREVVLGVSKVGRPASAPIVSEPDSAAMYEAAAADLKRGDIAAGQRQFELLVARYPDSDGAHRARRELAALYAAAATKPPATVGQPSFLGRGEAAAPVATPPISAWRTTVRPPVGLQKSAQDDLRATAGDLVFFSDGSAELGARARKALSAQAAWLARHPDRSIIIEGHADQEGAAGELRRLSEARAEAVRARLVEEGVAPERIRVVGHAAERRIAICADNGCASQNRRAATIIGGSADANLSPR